MAHVLWSNNAGTTLALSISNVDNTATLAAGTGAKFPSPTGGDYFTMTFSDDAFTMWEIVNVGARTGDVISIARAQEGTTALAWNAGDLAQNLLTAASLETLISQAVGGVLTGFLPNPGMAAGAAATNVGALGGALTGTLPNPAIATNVFLPGQPTTSNTVGLGDSSTKIATTGFVNPSFSIGNSGYRQNADGTIEQWSSIFIGPTGTFWTFPIRFPNAVLWVSGTTLGVPGFGDAVQCDSFNNSGAVMDYQTTGTSDAFVRAFGF